MKTAQQSPSWSTTLFRRVVYEVLWLETETGDNGERSSKVSLKLIVLSRSRLIVLQSGHPGTSRTVEASIHSDVFFSVV